MKPRQNIKSKKWKEVIIQLNMQIISLLENNTNIPSNKLKYILKFRNTLNIKDRKKIKSKKWKDCIHIKIYLSRKKNP